MSRDIHISNEDLEILNRLLDPPSLIEETREIEPLALNNIFDNPFIEDEQHFDEEYQENDVFDEQDEEMFEFPNEEINEDEIQNIGIKFMRQNIKDIKNYQEFIKQKEEDKKRVENYLDSSKSRIRSIE